MTQRWKLPIFVTFSLCITVSLLMRVADVQLWRGSSFRVLADDNRFYTLKTDPERGVLLDRFNEPLVWNSRRYYHVDNPTALHSQLTAISRDQALQEMATGSGSIVNKIERLYRYPLSLSHLVGYVTGVTADDLSENSNYDVNDQKGKLGLEAKFDTQLRGRKGQDLFEINALGQRQKKVSSVPSIAGENIKTSLDPYLSEVALSSLGQNAGAVIVLDARTGQALAVVSSPSYDGNILTKTAANPVDETARQQAIQSLLSDPRQLFFNRALSGQYPPGSVFKIVTALAGLEAEKIDASTSVTDEGVLRVGIYEYGNWLFRQYGQTEGAISLLRAISRSNDIYFYKAAEWVGPEQLAIMARLFGLGEKTGIGVESESWGLVPDPEWKEHRIGEQWYLGDTYHMGIGQGNLLVSPIQVAQMVQAVANTGTLCPPTLLSNDKQNCRELSLQAENIDLVLRGMLDACSAGGTAYPFFPYNKTRRQEGAATEDDLLRGAVACKTGTAEFGASDTQGYKKTHGWFVAIKEFNPETFASAGSLVQSDSDLTATDSASPEVVAGPDLQQLRQAWIERVQKQGLPQRLVFVSLVESSEANQFQEGSTDASPVIKRMIDWMEGQETLQIEQPSAGIPAE